jgi:hypothetical protein
MNKSFINMKKIFTSICIVLVIFTIAIAPRVQAQGQAVPIDTKFNWHNIQQQSKDFVLNSLAWNVAKMALQQLTTSIVNWINTGFEGSPAFISNPEGFFLDLGDQITGDFIANTGVLQGLCSPWNIDLRLAIGLGQSRQMSERYTCTLGSIIGNAKNASVNGYSIEGFTSGDFSQGGWPAFIALTTEPQNNPYGSYLQAKSDLEAQILGKQTAVNNDLNRGQGFLSWEKCETKVSDMNNQTTASQLGLSEQDMVQLKNTGRVSSSNGTKYRAVQQQNVAAGTGSTYNEYQTCSVQTPGSVIGAGLNKSLGSSVDQLNLADSINEITSALFAQLITQVLTKGLGGTTQRSSGSTQSYIDQLYSQSSGTGAYLNSAQNIQGSYAPYIATAIETEDTYRQAVDAFALARADFALAQGCFQDITVSSTKPTARTSAQRSLDEIQTILINQVATAENTYTDKYDQAVTISNTIETNMNEARNITDAVGAQKSATDLQIFTTTQVPLIEQARVNAKSDLTAAQTQAAQYDATAKQYIQQCQTLKVSSGTR